MIDQSYDQIFTAFEEIVNNFKRTNQYFDILYDSFSELFIEKSPFSEDISVNVKTSGIVARTFDGTWKEIALDNFSKLDSVTDKLPRVINKGEEIAEFEGWKLNKEIKPKINPKEITIEEKLNKIRYISNFIQNYDKRIVLCKTEYRETEITRIFVNNEGCQLRQVIPRTRFFIFPIVKEGMKIDFDHFLTDGIMGFEIFDDLTDEKLQQIADTSLEMLKAKKPPSGRFPVIVDPSMAGIIAHESFGHGLEADQVLRGRSYLKDKLNKNVASDICVICDTPSTENVLGFYFFDDEGIRAGKNILVENGILKNFIYDRRSASVLNATPQGNGRRESYAHVVHPRMSNTYFEPGDYDLEEMISDIKEGVMVSHSYFGMEDPLGLGMQCMSKKGYLIESGEKTQLLRGIALTGHVLEVLQNIDAISNHPTYLKGGTCGKGHADGVPVSDGGSYLRIKEVLISPG
ncbi:MAG: TldD/PmbA family protein [Candidatus Lokiarchaeota archaeon]|nr:TldD/PmbA family protein [Candidatus Lokiarchaeota archaeon]